MSDDNALRPPLSDRLRVVSTMSADAERRIEGRRDIDPANLHLVPEEALAPDLGDVHPDDLEPRVRELPLNTEVVELRHQAALLRQEHQDLDDSIHALEIMTVPDQILIARLKRKKLALRDRITTIEDRIRPDIIA